MKIAYVLGPSCLPGNQFSGVVVQARCWAEGLRGLGHNVSFPAPQEGIDWRSFDIIHLFQHGAWCDGILGQLSKYPAQLVFSPIIDPPKPYGIIHATVARIPFERARLIQKQRLLNRIGQMQVLCLARSKHEAESLRAVGVPSRNIEIVPIPMSKTWTLHENQVRTATRNGAVFHVSHLNQPRKNVRLLIDIAIERGFPLRLAGSISDTVFKNWLGAVITRHPNITYLGRISDDEMLAEMLSCSVFCLPSQFEGVGLVALDAACCGANLVVTNRGGTAEYLGPTAILVDPAKRASLARALERALTAPVPNLAARDRVLAHYTRQASAERLAQVYLARSGT